MIPKLNATVVRAIRHRWTTDHSLTVSGLAAEYEVSVSNMSNLLSNSIWRDADYTPPKRAHAQARSKKLSWAAVNVMRHRFATEAVTQRSLAEEHGLSPTTVHKIIRNLLWQDDTYTPPPVREAPEAVLPDGYEITADGRVKKPSGQWQPLTRHPRGYMQFTYRSEGKELALSVHRLVCQQFHGPRPSPKHQVRHLNGDPSDNRAENLAWGTAKENAEDRKAHGTHAPFARLDATKAKEIRQRYFSGEGTTRSLGAEYGVTAMTISKVLRNIFWHDPEFTPPPR